MSNSLNPDNKMIVTVAVNGSVPTKEQTPHVPVTPAEVIEDTVRCWEAGASIVHIHARDENQRPCHDFEFFAECLEGIRARCDIIVQFSTGSRGAVDRETRIEAVSLKPDMMSLNAGCCNFVQGPHVNSLKDIEYWLKEMKEHGVKPEIECFDLSHVYTGREFYRQGLIEPPAFFNIILGVPGALPYSPQNFMSMFSSLPEEAMFNSIGVGRFQLPVTVMATALGGHVRVGLEDNIYYSYRVLGTNREFVERAVRIAQECQREVAGPREARELLGISAP